MKCNQAPWSKPAPWRVGGKYYSAFTVVNRGGGVSVNLGEPRFVDLKGPVKGEGVDSVRKRHQKVD
jgi:hypothetical protein